MGSLAQAAMASIEELILNPEKSPTIMLQGSKVLLPTGNACLMEGSSVYAQSIENPAIHLSPYSHRSLNVKLYLVTIHWIPVMDFAGP